MTVRRGRPEIGGIATIVELSLEQPKEIIDPQGRTGRVAGIAGDNNSA